MNITFTFSRCEHRINCRRHLKPSSVGKNWRLHTFTALFTKPPDGLPLYRTGSGGRSVQRFPIDIFPFCRERPVTKEPAAL